MIVDAEFSLDPAMHREKKVCSNCGFDEAVFFISSDIEDTKIVLIYICNKCGQYQRKEVDE